MVPLTLTTAEGNPAPESVLAFSNIKSTADQILLAAQPRDAALTEAPRNLACLCPKLSQAYCQPSPGHTRAPPVSIVICILGKLGGLLNGIVQDFKSLHLLTTAN